jgi:hypothetical protein
MLASLVVFVAEDEGTARKSGDENGTTVKDPQRRDENTKSQAFRGALVDWSNFLMLYVQYKRFSVEVGAYSCVEKQFCSDSHQPPGSSASFFIVKPSNFQPVMRTTSATVSMERREFCKFADWLDSPDVFSEWQLEEVSNRRDGSPRPEQ